MARVIITVPDHSRVEDVAKYVRLVADQIEERYVSGHVNAETHWDSEGVR